MSQPLLNDTLLKLVGSTAVSNTGEPLGEIKEVTKNASSEHIEYIILQSSVCFGRGDRFFAVPASSSVVEVNRRGKAVLKLSKDDLQFAQGVPADACPKPNLKFGRSVYEIYRYELPKNREKETFATVNAKEVKF